MDFYVKSLARLIYFLLHSVMFFLEIVVCCRENMLSWICLNYFTLNLGLAKYWVNISDFIRLAVLTHQFSNLLHLQLDTR